MCIRVGWLAERERLNRGYTSFWDKQTVIIKRIDRDDAVWVRDLPDESLIRIETEWLETARPGGAP